jgi:predicted RNA-binding protein associated with RNAse of E/G family
MKKTYQQQLNSIRLGVKVVSNREKIHGLITDIQNNSLNKPENATVEVRLIHEGVGIYEYYPVLELPQYFEIDPQQ